MLLTSDKKEPHSAANAKPSWDNSKGEGESASQTSAKLFLCAVVHGGIMIGIGWIIVKLLMRS